MWANFNSAPGGSIGGPGSVFIGHDDGGFAQNKWFFALGGGKLNFHINGTGSAFLAQTSFNPNLNEWYNLGVVKTGNTYTTFINGTAGTSETNSNAFPNVGVFLTIGQAEGIGYHDGLIDDVAIYNRSLSNSEIQDIFNEITAVPEPATIVLLGIGLAGLWGMYLRRRVQKKE